MITSLCVKTGLIWSNIDFNPKVINFMPLLPKILQLYTVQKPHVKITPEPQKLILKSYNVHCCVLVVDRKLLLTSLIQKNALTLEVVINKPHPQKVKRCGSCAFFFGTVHVCVLESYNQKTNLTIFNCIYHSISILAPNAVNKLSMGPLI